MVKLYTADTNNQEPNGRREERLHQFQSDA